MWLRTTFQCLSKQDVVSRFNDHPSFVIIILISAGLVTSQVCLNLKNSSRLFIWFVFIAVVHQFVMTSNMRGKKISLHQPPDSDKNPAESVEESNYKDLLQCVAISSDDSDDSDSSANEPKHSKEKLAANSNKDCPGPFVIPKTDEDRKIHSELVQFANSFIDKEHYYNAANALKRINASKMLEKSQSNEKSARIVNLGDIQSTSRSIIPKPSTVKNPCLSNPVPGIVINADPKQVLGEKHSTKQTDFFGLSTDQSYKIVSSIDSVLQAKSTTKVEARREGAPTKVEARCEGEPSSKTVKDVGAESTHNVGKKRKSNPADAEGVVNKVVVIDAVQRSDATSQTDLEDVDATSQTDFVEADGEANLLKTENPGRIFTGGGHLIDDIHVSNEIYSVINLQVCGRFVVTSGHECVLTDKKYKYEIDGGCLDETARVYLNLELNGVAPCSAAVPKLPAFQ